MSIETEKHLGETAPDYRLILDIPRGFLWVGKPNEQHDNTERPAVACINS